MLKKFAFVVTTLSFAFMAACTDDPASGSLAGGTIDPNTIAEGSSSSSVPDELPIEMSSSFVDLKEVSSSSIEDKDILPDPIPESSSAERIPEQLAKEIVAECRDDMDKNEDANQNEAVDGPGGKLPVVYQIDGEDGFVTYLVETVLLPCGIVLESITVSAEDDTLFVNLRQASDFPVTNCICKTRVSFKIEKDDRFAQATHLVMNDDRYLVYNIISERPE
ncbi:hypothetical protein [Fibrobacter sp. UWH4]|uniref:hypothetical protein n=1 Tax=Fibrobacter sp. UWH4 TaxID=1896210 RepID=UPI000923EAE6|nr:hypothetical protein [Fibrobacter sp. UWH4]SHK81385.1 hypothetical protein SAMN05720762_103118 [Fibrobacter sp. UWH4]